MLLMSSTLEETDLQLLAGEEPLSQIKTKHVSLIGLLLASLSCQLLLFLQELHFLCSWSPCFHLPFDFQLTGMLFNLYNS